LLDITQRFLLEEKMRASHERLQLLELATQDVLWDWDLTTGRVTWNDAVARRLRYAPDDVRKSFDWHDERIHPEDRERVLRGVQKAILGVESTWTDEYRIRRGDGTYATVLNRAHVVRNQRNEPVRVVGWMLDITERKAAEEAQRFLAQASAALEAALDVEATAATLARLGVAKLSDFCLVDLVDPQDPDDALRRYAVAHVDPEREALLGKGATIGPGSDDLEPTILAAVREGVPIVQPCDMPAAQASRHLRIAPEAGVHAYMVVPIKARGRVLGCATFGLTDEHRHFDPLDLVVAEDLARRASQAVENACLYATAQRAVAARNEVLGVVSHDLRVPVNTILGSLSLLAETVRTHPEDVGKWFERLSAATEHMNALIENLLDVSRMESNQFAVHRKEVAVQLLVNEACELLRPAAVDKKIEIECQVGADLRIWADGPQIVRALDNLIGNAVKFSPVGRTVWVRAEAQANELQISVHDEGIGIPAEQLPQVFDRFWKGRHADQRGTGLGLSIAKGIAEAHGGRIWVQSQGGVGSTFTFTIPLGRPDSPDAAAAETSFADTAPAPSMDGPAAAANLREQSEAPNGAM